MKKKYLGLLGVILLIVIDQITKIWAKNSLMNGSNVGVIKGVFELSYLENRGAAWGMFSSATVCLGIVSFVVSAVILYAFFKIPNEKKYVPMAIILLSILAGAIGNMIDRIFRGYVIDFLYFKLINFPVFNVADCYVTVAGVCLVIVMIFYYEEEELEFLSLKKKK